MIVLTNSDRKGKRYMVIVDGKKIHFSSSEHENYTMHKDNERKQRYIKRHIKEKKRWHHLKVNLMHPSYWSRWVSWNRPTIRDSVRDIEKKQKLDIIIDL